LIAPEIILILAFIDWTGSSIDLTETLNLPGGDSSCTWTETHAMLARMGGLRVVGRGSARKRLVSRLGHIRSNVEMPTVTEIQDRSKGDAIAKTITIIQTLWFAIQVAHRANRGLIVTELELTTLGHVVLNIFIYWCWWNKPLSLGFPVDTYVKRREEEVPSRVHVMEIESQRSASRRKLPIRVRFGAFAYTFRGKTVMIMYVFFSVLSGIFGAIHCLAWNSTFPTWIEKTIWRVSASVITAIPFLAIYVFSWAKSWEIRVGILKAFAATLFVSLYCLGRIFLLAVALAALRALPERAYETPSWTVYVPHIG